MGEIYCPDRPGIVILASGEGTTAEAIIRATREGKLEADVRAVVCNNPPSKAGIYGRIARLNELYSLEIPVKHISGLTHPGGKEGRGQTLEESAAIYKLIIALGGIAVVVLAGYMKVVRGDFLEKLEGRIINSHPGPLPLTADTHGLDTSRKVLEESDLDYSAVTFHLVSAGVDEGSMLAEYRVDVLPYDTAETLFGRVQAAEKKHFPPVLGDFLQNQRVSRS